MKLNVVKCGINGEGIAYLGKKPVFLPGAFPEEYAECEITEDHGTYAKAKLKRILTPSSSRRPSPCPYSRECGGCPLIELNYESQLKIKRDLLAEALWKYGHVKESLIREIRPSAKEFGYRSALKLPVQERNGKAVCGMYKTGTNHFTEIDQCPLHDETLEAIRRTVLAILHEENFPAYEAGHGLRYLIMRRIDHAISIALITGKDELSETLIQKLSLLPEVTSIVQSVNTSKDTVRMFGSTSKVLYGEETIAAQFHGFTVYLSAESFFQLNLEQAEALYETAVSKVDPCGVLVEAYCGIGVMSLMAKDKARKVYGMESVPQAIENAKRSAEANRVPNLTFRTADAAEGLAEVLKEKKVDILLADPPRAGMDQAMIDTILSSSISKIIYVSCNPATLGRNIHELKREYDVRTVIPFDLFPNTPHCESVTVLTRRGTSDRTVKRKRRKKANHEL